MLAKIWKKGKTHDLLVEMQIGAATMENSMKLPQNIKLELSYDPVVPLLAICQKKPKTYSKEYTHPYAHCSIIYNSQNVEAV